MEIPTERLKALEDAERRLKAILEHVPAVLFEVDAKGTFVASEGRGLEAIGLKNGERVGQSIFEMYASQPVILEGLRKALAGQYASSTAELLGNWYDGHLIPSHSADGSPSVIGWSTIINESKQLTDLIGTLDAIVWMAEANSLVPTFVSQRATTLLGYPASAWNAGASYWKLLLDPSEQEGLLARWRQVAADGLARSSVHRVRSASGQERWFRTSVRAVRKRGRVEGLVGLMVDLTDRARAEEALKDTEIRSRMMFEQIPALVYTVDRELRFTSGTGAALASLGLQANQIVGASLFEYFSTDDENHPAIAAHRRAIAGESVRFELQWHRTFQTYCEPFRDASGEIIGAIAVALDKTEQKRAEQERDQLLEKTQQALQAREEFLSIAAHELNTPLAGLQLSVQALQRYGEALSPDRRARTLKKIEQQTRRISSLVTQLLDVSRIQAGRLVLERGVFDLRAMVSQELDRLVEEYELPSGMITLAPGTPVLGAWDRNRLEQVVINLLTNAIKFGEGKPVHVRVEAKEGRAQVSVRDEGIGISPGSLDTIFHRFERAVSSRHYGGLGLGLYIVKLIVDAHGGSVRATSTPGQGALFIVDLPLEPNE